ncbi:hypothetical protein [Streptomyces sp. ALI-76-A]|jgi:hypothetical protein|uniref:hypothetical protein n=1 Tax=Streptomyces sp. ALI-76-A TaxID=3025736 RepID=UPI00256F20E6|nr:hypothetical protein [Streptomyces sp. ALI-76-A]MDL5199263.1 hypothetical protein [Streptomyces sp. ALI-76-A]
MTDIPLWRRPTRSGWRVEADEARTRVDVIDAAGQVRASVATEPVQSFTGRFAERMNADKSRAFETNGPSLPAPAREPAPLSLRSHDDQAFVSDGAASGRRREKTGRALVHGRRYSFLHTGGKRAEALRDGTRIASFRKHGSRPHNGHVTRTDHGVLDETDELVLTVFEKLLRPGRPGAVSDAFASLG